MNNRVTSLLLILSLIWVGAGCGSGPGVSPTEAPDVSGQQTEEAATEAPTPTTEPELAAPTSPPLEVAVSTSAFEAGGDIPERFSCMGDNVSPELAWVGVPVEVQSLLLFLYDPDAGFESGASVEPGFVHWVVYNIPPTVAGLPEDVAAGASLDNGALQGKNDFAQFASEGDTMPGGAPFKLVGYDGPCPGSKHEYVFALYALDTLLDLPEAPAPKDVLEAMAGHVIGEAEVAGFYAPPQ